MNERNAFQQQVDRSLSHLQWNEGRRQKVRCALHEERRPIHMKKLTRIIAVAVVLCLTSSMALAATLVYSQRYSKAAQADALLMETFGVTADMQPFFVRTVSGDIVRYKGVSELAGMTGDYLIDLSTGEAKWLFDGPDAAGWNAAKLAEVLPRCQTADGSSQVVTEAREAAAAIGLQAAQPTLPSAAELEALLKETAAREAQAQAAAFITLEDAESLARAAIQEKYGLTDAQMQQLDFEPDSTMYTLDGDIPVVKPYFWLRQSPDAWTPKDGIYIVVVNVLDGSIEDMLYDSALLGNG